MIKEPIQKLRLTSVDSTHHSQPIIGVMIVMQADWITAPSAHFNTLKINALYWRVRVVNNNWKTMTSVDSTHHSQPMSGVMIVMPANWITAPSAHFNTLRINVLYWRVRVVNNNWKTIRFKSLMFLLMISKVLYQLIAIQKFKIVSIKMRNAIQKLKIALIKMQNAIQKLKIVSIQMLNAIQKLKIVATMWVVQRAMLNVKRVHFAMKLMILTLVWLMNSPEINWIVTPMTRTVSKMQVKNKVKSKAPALISPQQQILNPFKFYPAVILSTSIRSSRNVWSLKSTSVHSMNSLASQLSKGI